VIRIEPRDAPPRALRWGLPPLAALAALALAAIPLWLAGADVTRAYGLMAQGVFGSAFAVSEMLTRATPLILTGLAAAVAFRARLWNIGAEGQPYPGALAGSLAMAAPTVMKARLGVDEVVTTLLLNFVIILFVQMMLEGPFKDPMGMGWPQSEPMVEAAMLPRLFDRMRVHAGLLIGLAAALAAHVALSRTTWGFRVRAVGENPAAARHAGISVGRTLLGVGAVSGALAGLAGVGEVAGLKGYLTADLSPGFGYAGIVVAMLAGLSPLGVVAAALFVASVFVGADSMSRALGVSSYLADLIVALSLICVLAGGFLARYRVRMG